MREVVSFRNLPPKNETIRAGELDVRLDNYYYTRLAILVESSVFMRNGHFSSLCKKK